MIDDELIEKIARAIDPDIPWKPHPTWNPSRSFVERWKKGAREKARAALAIARPIIEREALERAINLPLLLEIQSPKIGPFTREDRVLAQYRDAIRALIPNEEGKK